MTLSTTFVALAPAGNGVDDGKPAGPMTAVIAVAVILLLLVIVWLLRRYLGRKPPGQE